MVTDLSSLCQWVREGWVERQTPVRKGELNWLEAQRVPTLRGLFASLPPTSSPNDAVCRTRSMRPAARKLLLIGAAVVATWLALQTWHGDWGNVRPVLDTRQDQPAHMGR